MKVYSVHIDAHSYIFSDPYYMLPLPLIAPPFYFILHARLIVRERKGGGEPGFTYN